MATWPTIAQLKSSLGVTSTNLERDALLEQALGAAIEQVGHDIGYEDVVVSDVDTAPILSYLSGVDESGALLYEERVPTYSLAQAALLLAQIVAKAKDAPLGAAAVFDAGGIYVARSNPNYRRLLVGSRLHFGVG